MELFKTWLLLVCVAGTFAAPFASWGSRHCSQQSTCNSEHVRYESGKTYTYQYNAVSSTWINGTSEEKSSLGFSLKAQIDVISPCELTLKLKEVGVVETGPDGEPTPATNQDALRSELQDHVLRFAFNEGVVTDVCPSMDETTWALNFKRGFLSAIQAPVTEIPADSEEPVIITETDVTGKCSAKLTPSPYPGSIMKTKDFKKCEKHTKLEGGIQSTMLRSDAPLFNILECSQECEVAFQSNIVSQSVCLERHISKPFSMKESGAMTEIRVTVDNLRVTDSASTPGSTMIERQTTIFFDHKETRTDTQPEIISKAKQLLESISRKLIKEIGIEMPNLFSDLVTEMQKIETLSGMTQLRQFVEAQNAALVEVFRDALQMCETTPSIETMVAIIKEVAASTDEAVTKAFKTTRVMWLTQPAVIRHPTKGMIAAIMTVIKTLNVEDSVFFLPVSSLINKYCTSENPACLEETEVRMAIEYFQELLGYDCTPTEEVPSLKMLMALKALTNIRRLSVDGKISIINNCFDHHNPNKRTEIRVAALELIRRLPCNPEYQNLAKAMFKNHHFDSELRIGAYRAIMTCPSDDIMEVIKEVMMEEECQQVGSYVWSHLSNLNETSDPQKQSLKEWVQKSGVMPAFNKLDLRKFSRNVELSWYNDEMSNGLTLDGDMIFSPDSFLPRQLKLNSTVSLYGYAINLFEVGGRLEGMHHFLEKFFGPRGFFKENSFKDLVEDYQQKQQEAFLNKISKPDTSELPEGLPQGVTLEMYNKLQQLLRFQQKLFGGKLPLPLPGDPMPKGMPEGMTQEMYDELLVIFIRDGVPGQRKKRHLIKESSINDIHASYHSHAEDKPDASVYFKMFGNELGYLDIEKIRSRFTEMKSDINPMKIMMDLAKEQTHELNKNVVLMDGAWCVPTLMGLPLRMTINGTVSMKVRTSGKIDMRGILMAPRSFEINGIIEPSAAVEISTSMEVTARTTRSGLNHISRLHSSVSLSGKIQVTKGKAFEVQLNVPEEKQEIIDVSSSIYLRRQDESYEMPGIPERLELSYCSGTTMTKYLGIQVCSELAYPKSYVKQTNPMFPLTGPGRMLVTIEKTDPSLTSWKIEGSYGLEKETVENVKILTDKFHFMMGAPETDSPRTVQVDLSYNRNNKEMDLNLITPFKTADLHSKVVNSEMLRKLEISLTLDKTSVYTLDAEVDSQPSVVDGDIVINFFPRLDITSPNGMVVKFRSSIAVRDGQQKRVGMQMSLDTSRTALITVSGDVVKTESSKKIRYSSDLQITGRYVNVNVSTSWQKQKRDNIITVDATVLRRVNGEIVKEVVISTKYTNNTVEGQNQWDLKTEWVFPRYPLISFLFETEYTGRTGHSEGTSKLCYRYNGQECSQDTKIVMGHLLTWESSETTMNEVMNLKLRNPTNNINIEIQQRSIRNETHPLDFSLAIVNNTSEKEIIRAALRQHRISEEPLKGDFEVSLTSQTWKYAVIQDWEIAANDAKYRKFVTNTTVHWEDQKATLMVNYVPTVDVLTGLELHNFTAVVTYPLGSLSTNWFVSTMDRDFSHGGSMFLIDQQLFVYRIDYTNHGVESNPDSSLLASFNITRPASQTSLVLSGSYKDKDINGGFNITFGSTKLFTSGFSLSSGIGEDDRPKTEIKMFTNVEIPDKDFTLDVSYSSLISKTKRNQETSVFYNRRQVYYEHTIYVWLVNHETNTYDITYDITRNMSYPLYEIDMKANIHIVNGAYDYQIMVFKSRVPIVFLKVAYDKTAVEGEERQDGQRVETDRHALKVIFRTPLVIMKDIKWNVTLDLAPATFNFENSLLYFPDQARPFRIVVNYQNKSSELVTHNELRTTFETVKRQITIFNVAKFDLDAGTILGSSSVEFGVHGAPSEKFEMEVAYTNATQQETNSHTLTLTLASPDNTIRTETSVMYIKGSSIRSSISVAVSEKSIFGVVLAARNDSDGMQTSFDVDTTISFLEYQYRIHAVHDQAANSLNPNIKVYRSNEENPIAEVDMSYTKVNLLGEIHTVILLLKSEDIPPLTITTIYSNMTDAQNVAITISASEDKNIKFDFDLATGSSETETATYDVAFTVSNTYLPDRNLEVTTHFGTSDKGHNLDTNLVISNVHMMNLIYTWLEVSSSDVTQKDLDLQVTLPQMSEYPVFSKLAMRLDSKDRPEVKTRKAAFLWGQLTDNEMVSLSVTSESDLYTIVIDHPMDLEPLPKEITLLLRNNTQANAKRSFDIKLNDKDVNLMMLAGSYARIDSNESQRRATLTLSRLNHPDIQVTLDAAVNNGETVFGSTLSVKYSEDEDKLIQTMIEMVNKTNSDGMAYDFNFLLRHQPTGLDMSTALTLLNNKKAMTVGLEGEALVNGELQPYNFEIKWNKLQKEYSIISDTPLRKIALTGQFEDRSYSEHKIYRVTMTNAYDDVTQVRSMFEFNSQSKEITYTVHTNPDQPEDFMRFRAGFLNETALVCILDSELDGVPATDARVLVSLQTPKILLNHVQWNPEWPLYVYAKSEQAYSRVLSEIENRRLAMAESRQKLSELIQKSYDDFLLSNAGLNATLVDMKERFDMKVQAKKDRWADMKGNFTRKSEEYWQQFRDDVQHYILDLQTRLDELKKKYAAWGEQLKTDADEYVQTTKERVKTFYNNNVKPIFEEFKELFDLLAVKHQVQLDLLFPQIRPYGDDFLVPEPEAEPKAEPKAEPPQYMTGVGEDVAVGGDNVIVTSIYVPDEKYFSTDTLTARLTNKRLGMIKLWQSIEKLWNSTKEEFEAMIAEWETGFKGSAFYADVTEKLEELKERFPVEQWREEMAAKIEEIRSSEDVQDFIAVFRQIREELKSSGNVTIASLKQVKDKVIVALKDYKFDIMEYLKYPTYEVLRYDLENGEILVLLHLPYKLYSLQELPESIRHLETLQRLKDMIVDVRERSKNTLGEIIMADGSIRTMFELMFTEPMLLYREGNITQWYLGEKIKLQRRIWEGVHFIKMYLNPTSWIPPYEANAMIVGSNHFVTFDRTFYDFSGGCSYVLAHDFIDGNFTVIVDYDRETTTGDRSKSIVLHLNDTNIFEIKSDFTVYHGKQPLELPFQYGRTTIKRFMNAIQIQNTNGIAINCDIAHDICNVDVSGWYYGKTAGLFGTYNYEKKDDFTTSQGEMARHVDDFTRSWKVGRRCSGSSSDTLQECNTDPKEEVNALCAGHFLDEMSSLTNCLGVVDPAPYYAMCISKMCQLSADQRKEAVCSSVMAYVNECNRMKVGIAMPKTCVVCDTPNGPIMQDKKTTLREPEVIPKSADVVVVVEEKKCNADLLDNIGNIIDIFDTELKNTRQFADNRFGLLGFGGQGVHDLPHIHTIGGAIFNDKRPLSMEGLPSLMFAEDGSNDTFAAILAAANYPFRAGVAKHIILLSCSDCQRLYHKEKTYTKVSSTLMRQGIQFNLLMNAKLELVPTRAKNTSPKNQIIYGIDNRTVFTNKALNSGTLIGDKTIRKHINEPVNQCALLAFESGGALFDSSKISEKKFVDVLTQRMVEHTVVEECQICSCKADGGVGRNVCQSCSIAEGFDWYFDMERTLAEADYYSRLGMQTVVDYINEKTEEKSVNKTPKKLS